ncbi:PAS domain-containing sensor histidine kinase [Pedobacter sp. UBA5917]|jgi:PAS domain S-box-containing protein|uniref:PAS domain-containing sensor histidine kinase n=1 Tax=Pedobacter sp. UBA5917 TaxID=1947061 RepID=UPI0025D81B1D|nr:ATP-binding protein [Pedobacter sp. UBA5917]
MHLDKEILAGLIEGSPYPMYLVLGDELRLVLANAATLKAWGKDSSVIGKKLIEILPEFAGQPFGALMRGVLTSGEPYHAISVPITIELEGQLKTFHYNLSYQPVKGANDEIIGVVCHATDVTQLVESADNISRLGMEAVENNERLATINEALAATNEELATTNEELTESARLLELSEARFRNLILQAPFAICVIRATDLVVTEVNNRYLELVGKKRSSVDGKPIWDAVAEAAEAYAPVMEKVIQTGEAFFATEAEVLLIRNELPEQVFIDFVYEPVTDLSGLVSAIMVVGIDVSDKVRTRHAIEEMEERIRLAVEAAEIGTYELNYKTGELVGSTRFDEMFGLGHGVARETIIDHYHPDDVHLSVLAHEEAKNTGQIFYEARYLREGFPMKWLRFQAKVYFDALGNRLRTLGTVMDITAYKALQQQKDDFISIASHELKTPLTTLKASLQLLVRMRENPDTVLFPKVIDQASRSMDKITELVDDLLNVSKINQGHVGLKKNWFNLGEMLEKCCIHVRESGNHDLVLAGDKNLMVFADEHRIDQVVVNLVNNAVKYAPDSKEIFLEIEPQADRVKVSVRDNGPGIPADKLPHLFDRYFRADEMGTQVSGLGLGLFICADIIKRHGGEIGVESEPGEGSKFFFTLPLGENVKEI